LQEKAPYLDKIIKMASEPIAFQLYKNRDFYILEPRAVGLRILNLRKNPTHNKSNLITDNQYKS